MSLSNHDILLDTYNLRLKKGSGIKTYGRSLFETLDYLGARLSLLTDRPVRGAGEGDLAEVLLYDQPAPSSRLGRMVKPVIQGVRNALGPIRPSTVAPGRVIPDDTLDLSGRVHRLHNAPRVFDFANLRYKRFRNNTLIKLDTPPSVWHATTPLPIRVHGARMITTIHDLIPLRLPYTTLDDKRAFYMMAREAVRDSDLIMAISESTKRDIQSFFDVPDEKIAVTYQALPSERVPVDDALSRVALSRFELRRQEYVLFVGNIEPKKNVRTLIEAMAMMDDDLALVIVGRKAWLWKEELEAVDHFFGTKAQERVRMPGFVPDALLQALYANALCLAFPSRYEGFGLPPLEAMRQGCPVVTSNVSSLPEVCGEAALYVDPLRADQIRHRIEEIRDDEALRRKLISTGYRRVEHFSVERYAERLAEAYARVLT